MITRSLTGTVEISTAALTVTEQPPVFTGEAGALAVSLSFLNNGTPADVSAYAAEMYLFWPERREMTDTVTMTVSGSTASAVFPDALTVAAGAPLLIVQLTDAVTAELLVACAQPVQITETRGIAVITTRPPTPSEVIYVGRSPYVDPTSGIWMEWDADTSAYISTGITAKGDTGTSIVSITKTSTAGNVDTYTILLSDGVTHTFTVTNGATVASVTKTGTSGLVDTWTITMTDGSTQTFTITNGRGISRITGPVSSGLLDTYTIEYNDGTTSTFVVSNGSGIASIAKKATSGLVDTYEITYTNGTTSTYPVTNGRGITAITGPTTVGLTDTYEITYNDSTSRTYQVKNGRGITAITGPTSSGLTDTYTITYNDGTSRTYEVENGKGVLSSEIRYQAGTSGTVIPTGTWLTDPPTVPQGGYLWVRTVTVYNDGTDTTAYAVAYQGTDGSGAVSTVDGISPVSQNVTLLTIGTAPPTSATTGQVESRYFDKTEGCLYICTASSGGSQTWQMAGSSIEVDTALSPTSTNPVTNAAITAALATKLEATALDIQILLTDWSAAGQTWPDGGHPLGTDSASTCYKVAVTTMSDGTTPIVCADGDDFKPSEWSQAKCPAPLYVYVDTNRVWVATQELPSGSITIRGLILHNA